MKECHKLLIDQVNWMNPKGDQVRVNYLRHDSKGSSPALSISKMKAASYPDFGLELLVPEQMWIEDSQGIQDQAAQFGYEYAFLDSKGRDKEQRVHRAIERRLKTRRIYQNLECFVGGRVCDIDYRLLQRTE
nr:hypothetical protein [Tanacetum cinerariifolium]